MHSATGAGLKLYFGQPVVLATTATPSPIVTPKRQLQFRFFRFGALVPFSISVAEQLGSLVQILCKNVILEVSPLLPCNFLETSR